jgi:hypothetical protein
VTADRASVACFPRDDRDLAGEPVLMSAPCSHCEQTSTRGSDVVVTPVCPQCGQVFRVSMSESCPAR